MKNSDINHLIRNPLAIIMCAAGNKRSRMGVATYNQIKGAIDRIVKVLDDLNKETLGRPKFISAPYDEFDFDYHHESGIVGASDFEVFVRCWFDRDGRIEFLKIYKSNNAYTTDDITEFIEHTDAYQGIVEKAQEIALERVNSVA